MNTKKPIESHMVFFGLLINIKRIQETLYSCPNPGLWKAHLYNLLATEKVWIILYNWMHHMLSTCFNISTPWSSFLYEPWKYWTQEVEFKRHGSQWKYSLLVSNPLPIPNWSLLDTTRKTEPAMEFSASLVKLPNIKPGCCSPSVSGMTTAALQGLWQLSSSAHVARDPFFSWKCQGLNPESSACKVTAQHCALLLLT